MLNPIEAGAWAAAAKSAVEVLRSAKSLLPTAGQDALAQKIEEAEQAIARADAKLAKELGVPLCECTFPPKPMLWKEKLKLFVCDNPECGRTAHRGPHISDELLRRAAQKLPIR